MGLLPAVACHSDVGLTRRPVQASTGTFAGRSRTERDRRRWYSPRTYGIHEVKPTGMRRAEMSATLVPHSRLTGDRPSPGLPSCTRPNTRPITRRGRVPMRLALLALLTMLPLLEIAVLVKFGQWAGVWLTI